MSTLDDWMGKEEKSDSSFFDEALRLYEEKRFREALVLINLSIEQKPDWRYYNLKGLILQGLDRFSESKRALDEGIKIKNDPELLENKANLLYRWANSLNDKQKSLEIITEAIEIIPDERFLYLKGSILDCLGRPIDARIAYLEAEGELEEVSKIKIQQEMLRNSKDTLVNITGWQFYFGIEVFSEGLKVDLVCEESNEHDPDAIRVEIDGETVGYVANSDYTLIENVKSASDIRQTLKDNQKAEILFIYFEGYVIAKLI